MKIAILCLVLSGCAHVSESKSPRAVFRYGVSADLEQLRDGKIDYPEFLERVEKHLVTYEIRVYRK